MATPTISYDSNTNLSLPAIPDVGSEEVNKALLDIHNALTNIITGVDPQILLNASYSCTYSRLLLRLCCSHY